MTTINIFDYRRSNIAAERSGSADDPAARDAITRVGDVALAVVLLLLVSPLLGITVLAIKCSGCGPVFTRCKRVTGSGRQIMALRFRITAQRPQPVRSTVCWDSPVSAVGRMLVLTRLDALPQLINVLHGEMTLIGDELERPDFLRAR